MELEDVKARWIIIDISSNFLALSIADLKWKHSKYPVKIMILLGRSCVSVINMPLIINTVEQPIHSHALLTLALCHVDYLAE